MHSSRLRLAASVLAATNSDAVTEEKLTAAVDFGKQFCDSEDRLVAIFEDIIKNGGTFKPWRSCGEKVG